MGLFVNLIDGRFCALQLFQKKERLYSRAFFIIDTISVMSFSGGAEVSSV